jgi:copper chaperone CopZ
MIRKTVRKVRGVDSVSVSLDRGVVEFVCDSSEVRRRGATEAIERMGYKVVTPDNPGGALHPDSVHTPIH